MPNLDPWINQFVKDQGITTIATTTLEEEKNKFENHLLSIKAEHQKRIRPNLHPAYNERHEKIIELIDWTLEKYKTNMEEKTQQQNEQVIIDNIIEELDKKRDIAINKKKRAKLKDEVWKYGEEEDAIDYVIFIIRELTGKLYK
jgi:hypothetical protein